MIKHLALVLGACFLAQVSRGETLPKFQLPPGFRMEVFASNLESPRSLTRSPGGVVFAGTINAGKVYALLDADGDGRAEKIYVVAEGLQMPNGVAFHQGALYIAELTRILRLDGIETRLAHPPKPVVVYDKLPDATHHGWRYIAIGPDEHLYVGVGAPCNVCLRAEAVFASILRMDLGGKNVAVYARGVRNSVGFDWHPDTGKLWFTDNGRDWLGDELPPDELNVVNRAGENFGFPHCHAGSIRDPEFGAANPCPSFTPPAQKLGPHVAALGMLFYRGQMFPTKYHKQIFIAEHGSWNRSKPLGYRLSLVTLHDSQAQSYEVFAHGWQASDGSILGRPVDLVELADGSLVIADDTGNRLYRLSYQR